VARCLALSLLAGASPLLAQTMQDAAVPSGSPLSPPPSPSPAPAPAPPAGPLLPTHTGDPMAIDMAGDPLLHLAEETSSLDMFRRIVAETIARAPASAEAEATRDEADAAIGEAKSERAPTIDLTLSSYRVLSRNFGNNPENIIEEARPNRRTDQLIAVDQLLMDGGAASARIAAAQARLKGADLDIENAADRTALETIAAWYDVFTYHSLVDLSTAFTGSQRELRAMVGERIKRGVSAPADMARVDSYIANAETRLARFRRQAQQADARFEALTGRPPPEGLARAPFIGTAMSRDLAAIRAAESPAVRSARSAADAARRDAKAAHADMYPTLSAGLDAGRYGIYETPRDYDVRARLTFRQRLFGGLPQRAKQADARARSTDARAERIASDAMRDAEIAWSDVIALEEQRRAIEATYTAARRSRDAIAERFRVSSGTLFDVIGAEDNYFETAASFIQALTELDAARYVLLSRTGTLLPTLGLTGATAAPEVIRDKGKRIIGPLK
jgi:adhesin transport system outer membrane protein